MHNSYSNPPISLLHLQTHAVVDLQRCGERVSERKVSERKGREGEGSQSRARRTNRRDRRCWRVTYLVVCESDAVASERRGGEEEVSRPKVREKGV